MAKEKVYQVTYVRKSRAESDLESSVYVEDHFRTIQMVASSEKEAIEIADARLAKQFPDYEFGKPTLTRWNEDLEDWEEYEGDEEVLISEGSIVNGEVDHANAQSNYKLQGVEVIANV